MSKLTVSTVVVKKDEEPSCEIPHHYDVKVK